MTFTPILSEKPSGNEVVIYDASNAQAPQNINGKSVELITYSKKNYGKLERILMLVCAILCTLGTALLGLIFLQEVKNQWKIVRYGHVKETAFLLTNQEQKEKKSNERPASPTIELPLGILEVEKTPTAIVPTQEPKLAIASQTSSPKQQVAQKTVQIINLETASNYSEGLMKEYASHAEQFLQSCIVGNDKSVAEYMEKIGGLNTQQGLDKLIAAVNDIMLEYGKFTHENPKTTFDTQFIKIVSVTRFWEVEINIT